MMASGVSAKGCATGSGAAGSGAGGAIGCGCGAKRSARKGSIGSATGSEGGGSAATGGVGGAEVGTNRYGSVEGGGEFACNIFNMKSLAAAPAITGGRPDQAESTLRDRPQEQEPVHLALKGLLQSGKQGAGPKFLEPFFRVKFGTIGSPPGWPVLLPQGSVKESCRFFSLETGSGLPPPGATGAGFGWRHGRELLRGGRFADRRHQCGKAEAFRRVGLRGSRR